MYIWTWEFSQEIAGRDQGYHGSSDTEGKLFALAKRVFIQHEMASARAKRAECANTDHHRIGYKPAGSHYSVFVARSTTEQLSTILGAQGLASTQSLRVALIQLVEQAWMLLSDFHFDMSLADTPSDTVSWSPIFRSDPIVKQSLPVVHRPVFSPQGQPEKHQSRVMQR